jgi:uncharacterized protein YdiU (UPF0061 family)
MIGHRMPADDRYRPAPLFPLLGDGFFDIVGPAPFPRHVLRFRNQRWAERVGLGGLDAAQWEAHFARFEPLPGNIDKPLALRYHGHQFGIYNPELGDGRGFLHAQLRDEHDGRLLDLGTKGSGRTPWSRSGDGRLTLKGGVREVLATEMLEALGVTTSKSWSLFETGEMLFRGDEPSPARSSVLVRLSHSHIRFGTFQRHAHEGRHDRLTRLLDFAVEHYLPEVARGGAESLPVAFLREVSRRSARLAASFMAAGFVHGVLNTDNMNITGESFDYGPYRFLPAYDPAFTAAYFDEVGLYAFGHQPRSFVFNLTRLADALRPLSPDTPFAPALREFEPAFSEALAEALLDRLGLASCGPDVDDALVAACYGFLEESRVGFAQFFFDWRAGMASEARAKAGPEGARYTGARFEAFVRLLELYSPAHPEEIGEAYFQEDRPCDLLIDEVEQIWDAIAERDDWTRFDGKIEQIRRMGAALGR